MINIYTEILNTGLCTLKIITDQEYLIEINILDCNEVEETNKNYREKPEIMNKSIKQLLEYFNGERKEFDLKIKLNGTEFQKKVWNELKNIKYGETISYKELATRIGNSKASRAVGSANNKNKIPIVIPCHRVIGSSGKLVGYRGGLFLKENLIKHETLTMSR